MFHDVERVYVDQPFSSFKTEINENTIRQRMLPTA